MRRRWRRRCARCSTTATAARLDGPRGGRTRRRSPGSAAPPRPSRRTGRPVRCRRERGVSTIESDYYAFMGFDPVHTRDVLSRYVPLYDGLAPVLELACGRGELLDLLRDRGTEA